MFIIYENPLKASTYWQEEDCVCVCVCVVCVCVCVCVCVLLFFQIYNQSVHKWAWPFCCANAMISLKSIAPTDIGSGQGLEIMLWDVVIYWNKPSRNTGLVPYHMRNIYVQCDLPSKISGTKAQFWHVDRSPVWSTSSNHHVMIMMCRIFRFTS